MAKLSSSIFNLNDSIIFICLFSIPTLKNFTVKEPISATASQSGHCLTFQGQASIHPAIVNKKQLLALILLECYLEMLIV